MLNEARELQRRIFDLHDFEYKRYFANIDMSPKLVGVVGARGVGKTTFLIQYLKALAEPLSQKLYLSADSINISSLYSVAEQFVKEDGKVLIIDEIHKYPNFELELKKIHDFLDLKLIFSGSSALSIDNAKADLSRRAIVHSFEGLSFREFLELKLSIKLPTYPLEELLDSHIDIAYSLLSEFNLTLNFSEYLQNGYYPFYFADTKNYPVRLNQTINSVIESDIPAIFPIEYASIINLKKLVKLVGESMPFVPNMQELLAKTQMGENYRGLYRFLDYLDRAKILYLMHSKARGDQAFVKPDKIYLNNTNLHHAYSKTYEIGTIRETFFASQLRVLHDIKVAKKGDFVVDDHYTFEIGGKSKKQRQIKGIENSFVISDDIEIGTANRIPLWLFGFLY